MFGPFLIDSIQDQYFQQDDDMHVVSLGVCWLDPWAVILICSLDLHICCTDMCFPPSKAGRPETPGGRILLPYSHLLRDFGIEQ